MTSYVVVDRSQEDAQEYFQQLADAKRFVELNPLTSHIIVKLIGDEFGQGFHSYKLAYTTKESGYFGFRYIERDGVITPFGKLTGYK